jgi:uncharacterized 2Fe-2S/4Fe-4S cluster protein (DUF4445 family)
MKTILFAFFVFVIIDACKVREIKNEEWIAHVYENENKEYVGTCEIVMNGNNGYRGEVLRDTVIKQGTIQYEEMVLIERIK